MSHRVHTGKLSVLVTVTLAAVVASAETTTVEELQRRCVMSLDQAEAIVAGGYDSLTESDLAIALVCAGEALIAADRESDGEAVLLRVVESRGASNHEALGMALGELGALYARQRRVNELEAAWDDLVALQGDRLALVAPMLELAKERFDAGRNQDALELAARVERYHDANAYDGGVLDPLWLPDLYAAMGQTHHAEEIHQARLRTAHGDGEPLGVARRMDDYADYLETQGRVAETSTMHRDAEQLRQERLREVTSAHDGLGCSLQRNSTDE
jgi:hypothetical protein